MRMRGSMSRPSDILPENPLYKRKSPLEDIKDDFVSRMMACSLDGAHKREKSAAMPDGYCTTINYNKGGYQVIPAKDLR